VPDRRPFTREFADLFGKLSVKINAPREGGFSTGLVNVPREPEQDPRSRTSRRGYLLPEPEPGPPVINDAIKAAAHNVLPPERVQQIVNMLRLDTPVVLKSLSGKQSASEAVAELISNEPNPFKRAMVGGMQGLDIILNVLNVPYELVTKAASQPFEHFLDDLKVRGVPDNIVVKYRDAFRTAVQMTAYTMGSLPKAALVPPQQAVSQIPRVFATRLVQYQEARKKTLLSEPELSEP
jgi:hypothetical protein